MSMAILHIDAALTPFLPLSKQAKTDANVFPARKGNIHLLISNILFIIFTDEGKKNFAREFHKQTLSFLLNKRFQTQESDFNLTLIDRHPTKMSSHTPSE